MSEWKECKLEDVTSKIGSGATPTGGENSYKTEGISLIRSQNVYDFSFSTDGLAFIDDEQAFDLRNVEVLKNDILINITGESVTRCCIVPEKVLPARVNQHVAIIRFKKEVSDFKYIYYYLQSIKPELNSMAEIGCTRRALTKAMLENIDVLIPPLPEQRAIASVLSSLDDKIDLLHRQNKTLEAMAETLFRQWFVEEAEEEWEEKRLEELCIITRGASPRPIIKYVVNGTVPWIKIADGSRSSNFFIDSTNEFIIEEGVSKSVKVFPGDLILSNSATCGFPYFVELEGCIHDGWLLFRDFKGISKLFLFFFLKQIFRELNSIADGSVQNNLNTGILKEYPVSLPPARVVSIFDKQAGLLVNRIKQNIYQIRTLEKLRDTLLPKLMSGEVRITVWTRFKRLQDGQD